MNTRIPRHFAPQLYELLKNGMTMDEGLATLKRDGASIIESIIAIKEHTGCDLGKAKERIHSCPAWRDMIEATDKMWDELLDRGKE